MHPFFEEYNALLTGLHDEFHAALDGLPVEALDWAPTGDANSLAVLTVHTCAAEIYWIGDVCVRQGSTRDRAVEFRTQGVDGATLKARLDQALADSRQALAALTLEHLAETRNSPRHGKDYTVAWCLLHALEHTAQHVGHAQITRQLWNQRA